MTSHEHPNPEQGRFQFSLQHLLVLVTALCVLFAMAASMGLPGVLLFCFIAGTGLGIYLHRFTIIGITFVMCGLCLCLVPSIQREYGRRRRVQCQSNLRQIVMAMHQYNDVHGTLPPAYIADANGKPMHSWRVLLLPYLGPDARTIYNQYDFSEPWDGPNNRRLAKRMPNFFACPQDKHRRRHDTSYVVVTGNETVFNGSHAMSLDQLAAMDGTAITLLVVECAESGIHWMQPRDLRYGQMSLVINDPSARQAVRSRHGDGANVGLGDASCKWVSVRVDPDAWKTVFTANGEEVGYIY